MVLSGSSRRECNFPVLPVLSTTHGNWLKVLFSLSSKSTAQPLSNFISISSLFHCFFICFCLPLWVRIVSYFKINFLLILLSLVNLFHLPNVNMYLLSLELQCEFAWRKQNSAFMQLFGRLFGLEQSFL